MQGGAVPAGRQEEARSEAYLEVRCNDERPLSPQSASFARASLGEVRKGDVSPSEESLRSGRGLARYPRTSPSPAPATSNGANGFPVRRFPVGFAPMVM